MVPRSAVWRGLAVSIAGAVLISFETLLLRLVTADIWTIIWWRGVLLGATLLLVAVASTRSLRILRLRGGAEGLVVIAFAAAVFCFVSALLHTTVANTLVIGSAAPFAAALLSWIFLRERLPAATWIVSLVLVAGLFIIFYDSLRTDSLAGDLAALGYAFCLGAYFVALRRSRSEAFLTVIGYGGLLSAALAWPLASPLATSASDVIHLSILGILVVPLATLLLARGTEHLAAPDVTLIMMLDTLLGPLWVWLALGETPDRATFIGGALILATIVAHAYMTAARKPAGRDTID
ncbi:MAG TPA: DMT family transporter [Hypericibacter adhaerens]|uniref:DMT family transporter n=1 Tax=Hypericibacter adhaerens TaxID=2602016 RepID=UPI002BE397A4|nr:DMT family transporter [Hypericibacter adhaerens]HWA44838.1 DMT family transporter [Hypericibacter adhaerens]